MAPPDGLTEDCPECGEETVHAASVQIRTESEDAGTAEFNREPYRVSECEVCGNEKVQRMNDG